jgi:uncharacterized membrane protein YkvA (DUF1232 family)
MFNYFLIASAILYLLNPSAGVWEIIPDNIPIIGNLDEVAAVLLIMDSLKKIRKNKKTKK